MKKAAFLFSVSLLALSANATSLHPDTYKTYIRSFVCASPKAFEKDGFKVKVFMQGEVWKLANEDLEMDWHGYFKILNALDADEDRPTDLWAFSANAQDNVLFDSKYKPRKYIDHVRFNVDFRENAGYTQLLLPRAHLTRTTENPPTSQFQGHLIMTHIQDHFGASVPLDCF